MSAAAGAWGDLKARVLSAIVMALVGILAIWAGGWVFLGLIALITGVILWELARMMGDMAQGTALMLGYLGLGCLVLARVAGAPLDLCLLLMPAAIGLIVAKRPGLFTAYAVEIMIGAHALALVSLGGGAVWVFFIVAIVAASDILGYFAGRMLGGPKFWPKVSPKKTWSGTVAGWVGAGLVGLGFALALGRPILPLIGLAVLLGFAGQMGDIAESALKRNCGVKDSSALIPGHGGFYDRFDALLGAGVVAWVIITFVGPWW